MSNKVSQNFQKKKLYVKTKSLSIGVILNIFAVKLNLPTLLSNLRCQFVIVSKSGIFFDYGIETIKQISH